MTEAIPLLQVEVAPQPIIVDEPLPVVEEAIQTVVIEAIPLPQIEVAPQPIIVDEPLPVVEQAT